MIVIEVAIGPGGEPGMFRVEVVASPAGEASAIVELDPYSLLARRGLLQQAVLASAVLSRQVLPETEQLLREAGQVLFAALLGTGEVAGLYRASAAVAAERGEGLRVVLRMDTPALADLPWEAMYDQAAGAYVCRQDQLVRHVPVASVPVPLRVRPPLRILGVVSSPRGLPALDVEKEQDLLARALARPASQGLAKVHWAPDATWAGLQDLLLDREWHVLHFIGHGGFDRSQDEGVLALVREDGRADLVAAHRLVDLLRQARPMPRLVVLNSCSGAEAGVSDLFSGTAAALVRGGVSAVAAMQYEISDPAAVAFARGFYAAIARGRGVDDAVSSGRVAILGLSDRTLEWVTPVLYLRGHDSQLFTIRAPSEDTNHEGTATKDIGSTRRGQPGDSISADAASYGPAQGHPPGPQTAIAEAAATRAGQPSQVAHKNPGTTQTIRARRTRFLMDVVRAVYSISDENMKASSLARLVEAFAAADADRAERIAESIPEASTKAAALARLVAAIAATDPGRAQRIADRAEVLAESIPEASTKVTALAHFVAAIAATDPGRAQRIADYAGREAGKIPDEDTKASALSHLAEAIAATDPHFAEHLAASILDASKKATALAKLAEAIAATDPDFAERIAMSLPDDNMKVTALARLVAAFAAADPGRAQRIADYAETIAHRIPDQDMSASALARLAEAIAATDPDRAAWLATDALGVAQAIPDPNERAAALARLAEAIAATDPDLAGRLAESIPDPNTKASALARLAEAIAATDPDRAIGIAAAAADIARKIPDPSVRVSALARLAEATAATRPAYAARIAADAVGMTELIPDLNERAAVVARLVEAIAATDPDLAERMTYSIVEEGVKALALACFAEATAATRPDQALVAATRALEAAQAIPDEDAKASALARLAEAVTVITR